MKSIGEQAKGPRKLVLSIALICLVSMGLLIPGCKKTDSMTKPPDENTGIAQKLKEIDLEMVADNFVSPIGLVPIPDNSGRLVVIDQIGRLWVIDGDGNKLPTPFIDLTARMTTLNAGFDERGLLGLAFHPQ